MEFKSEVLSRTNKLFLHLPILYDPNLDYPLIIVLDGEMSFKSFASITELMGFQELIPHCIVVGIPNVDRNLDHAPVIEGYPESGRADLMIEFYEKELLPHLEEHFHISDRILWGHSFVGMFTTYVMLKRPDLFDGYISTSPTYRFIPGQLENADLEQLFGEHKTFFYFSYGSLEEIPDKATAFASRLKEEAPANLDWHYKVHENKNHDSNAIHSYMEALELYFNQGKE